VPKVAKGAWASALKRAADFSSAAAGIAVTAPLLVGASVLIKATSPGPLFFKQARAGRDGEVFYPYKFRTMTVSESREANVQVTSASAGVTPVGSFLRRTKLDELPQLLNVLKGEMALIGPRPTLPQQVEDYDDFQRQRLLVRPGMTGLAQVNGNASISWPERIKYDVHYVGHVSLAMDVAILLKTVGIVLKGEEHFARAFDESPYSDG